MYKGNSSGTDTITYRAYDGYEWSEKAEVTIAITENQPPEIQGSEILSLTAGESDSYGYSVHDPEGGQISLFVASAHQPEKGSVSISGARGYLYPRRQQRNWGRTVLLCRRGIVPGI